MQEIRKKAKEMMKGSCRVCPICDGRACMGEVPGMGGLGTAATFKNNINALVDIQLNMRLIHEVKFPSTSTTWFGYDLAMPVIAAPIGGMFNIANCIEEIDYVDSILQGCANSGIIGCTGDGVPPVLYGSGIEGITKLKGFGIPFVKPWDGAELEEKLDRAIATGCKVIGMDIDAAGLATLRKMGRPVAPKSPKELAEIVAKAHDANIKFILKGIMTAADAELAIELGADCIVVSNHGGRVLDHAPGTAKVLSNIAKTVHKRIPIIADGGVRSGVDVLKLLALGADIVGIGRPMMIAAVGGLTQGVSTYLDVIKSQLEQAMILTGCQDISSINEEILYHK